MYEKSGPLLSPPPFNVKTLYTDILALASIMIFMGAMSVSGLPIASYISAGYQHDDYQQHREYQHICTPLQPEETCMEDVVTTAVGILWQRFMYGMH